MTAPEFADTPDRSAAEVEQQIKADVWRFGTGYTYRGVALDPTEVVVYLPPRMIVAPPATPASVLDAIERMLDPYRELRKP